MTISVVIPTKNGGIPFRHLAAHLQRIRDRYGVEVLVIDSGSTDGTDDVAVTSGFRLHRILPEEFAHGRTRNLGIRLASGDIVCFLTQDVLPCTPDWPVVMADHFRDPHVAGVYGRQIPRDASTMEMYFVSRNYPESPIRYEPCTDGHLPRLGRVLFSDAFSALRRDIAIRIPYVDDIPVSEDQVWAHTVLQQGYTIVYEPKAEVLHAHRYSLRGLYRRHYLIGQASQPFGLLAGVTFGEGLRFLASELRYFMSHGHTHWIPWLLAYEFVRWLGLQMGRRSGWRPAMTRKVGQI